MNINNINNESMKYIQLSATLRDNFEDASRVLKMVSENYYTWIMSKEYIWT